MLSSLRNMTDNFLVKILLFVLVASFALWGIGDMVGGGKRVAVATIGEQTVSDQEYYQTLMRLRANLGEYFTPEIVQSLNLFEVTLGQLISEKLMTQESDFLKLEVSDALLRKVIAADPQFFNDKGIFDRDMFQRRLKQLRVSEQSYITQLRSQIRQDMLERTVTPNQVFNETLPDLLYKIEKQQREFLAFVIDRSAVEPISAPEEETLRSYYTEHKQRYIAPEYRKFDYVLLDKQTVLDQVKLTEDTLKKAYFEQQKQLKTPEKRDVRQLLYSDKAKAEQAYALLRAGASFQEAQTQVVPDNLENLELGFVVKTQLPAAKEEIFNLEEGGFTSPVQTEFGWHIFQVAGIVSPVTPSFDSLKPQLRKELAEEQSNQLLAQLIEKIEDSLAAGLGSDAIIESLDIEVQHSVLIDMEGKRSDRTSALDMQRYNALLSTGFKLEQDATSLLSRLDDGTYFLVKAVEILPERERAFDEVRGQIVADWKKQQNHEAVKRYGQTIIDALDREVNNAQEAGDVMDKQALAALAIEHLQSFDVKTTELMKANRNVAIAETGSVMDVAAIDARLLQPLFAAQKSGTSLPFVAYGDEAYISGLYLAELPLEKDQAEYRDLLARLNKIYEQEIAQQYLNSLRQRFNVTQNREAVQRVIEQF